MSTLSETLSSWRRANQVGAGGLMEKLTIDGALYDVKDPALEAMMSEIDSRLSTIEGSEVNASDVNFNNTSNGFTATDAQAAIEEALSKAIGTSEDLSSADTINAAKKYANEFSSDTLYFISEVLYLYVFGRILLRAKSKYSSSILYTT